MTVGFDLKYFSLFAIILAVEICIALFVKDRFVRPFLGDVLVIILLYCFLRIFLDANYRKLAAVGVFLFGCAIEVLQYFDYVKLLRLEHSRLLSVMLGRTFEWSDFAAYFTGFLIILLTERFFEAKRKSRL